MTQGQLERAERLALNQLDRWTEITGIIPIDTGYYYELAALMKDAVHIGILMSVYGTVHFDEEGSVILHRQLPFGTTVKAACGAPARSIDDKHCAYISSMSNDLQKDRIDFGERWDNRYNLPLPTDEQLENLKLNIRDEKAIHCDKEQDSHQTALEL